MSCKIRLSKVHQTLLPSRGFTSSQFCARQEILISDTTFCSKLPFLQWWALGRNAGEMWGAL